MLTEYEERLMQACLKPGPLPENFFQPVYEAIAVDKRRKKIRNRLLIALGILIIGVIENPYLKRHGYIEQWTTAIEATLFHSQFDLNADYGHDEDDGREDDCFNRLCR